MMKHEGTDLVLARLREGKVETVRLDLCFTEGEEIEFFVEGTAAIHLTGAAREGRGGRAALLPVCVACLALRRRLTPLPCYPPRLPHGH